MQRVLLIALAALLMEACSSGKAALKKGDYYDAVLESVHRLRSSPENKKAIAVLQQGYPLAIEYIETSIQNGIASDDPHKWRSAVSGYEKINFINDQIKTSLGAMKIIPKPATRFKELADAKSKAAEEAYQAGIAAMMKNTRNDSKEAYFDFKEANNYETGYKESIEMMTQAEYNATIRIAYEEINASRVNYGSLQPVVNGLQRQFLSFRPMSQRDTVPPHQYLRLVFNNYLQDPQPTLTRTTEEARKDVKVGEKKGADGKMVDVLETVVAKVTYYRKSQRASANATFIITDVNSNAILQQQNVVGNSSWQQDWATFTGDARALSANQQSLCRAREAYPNVQELFNQAIRNLENNLGSQLKSFYSSY